MTAHCPLPTAHSLRRALVRWQRAAGQYWAYVCAAPFVGELDVGGREGPRARVVDPIARLLARIAASERAAVFLDLPPSTSLAAAPGLSERGFLVVPVIQRWAAAPAVLPCGRLLEQLVGQAARLRRPPAPVGVVFFLDGERAGRASPSGRPTSHRAFDNRYTYRADRFPPPELLRREGITTIHWLSRAAIAADLLAYTRGLAEAGFSIDVHSTARGDSPSPPGEGG